MKKIKKNNPILIWLVIFGLLFFLHSVGALRPIENLFLNLVEPTSGRLYRLGNIFNNSYKDRESQTSLAARVEELTKEVARLKVINSQQEELVEENLKLKNQLNFLNDNSYQSVVAAVIARESLAGETEMGQDLLVNKGIKDGVIIGQGVINEEGLIVGKVIEVKETSAKICLTTSSECKLAASIQNETRTQGITDGDLGLTIKMNYVPQMEKISIGDTVITSGLGGKIPRGLVIGQVIEIRNESNEVWQDATIEPLVNLNNLTFVTIIIS